MAGADEVVAGCRAAVRRRRHAVGARPQRQGRALATAAGVDHLTITVSASPAYSTKNVNMTIDEALAQVEAIRAAAPDRRPRRGDLVLLRLPVPRRAHHARRRRPHRRARPRPRHRPGHAGRHHRDGDAAPHRGRPRRHGDRRRPAPPRHPGHRAGQRVVRDRARRRALRHRPRRSRRLAVRPDRRRQPRHRGPRPAARRRRHRRPASTSTALLAAGPFLADLVGHAVPSRVAGRPVRSSRPRRWGHDPGRGDLDAAGRRVGDVGHRPVRGVRGTS